MNQSFNFDSFKAKKRVFDDKLQEFAQRSTYISGLQTNGKVSAVDAYQQIKALWKQLETAKQQLED